MSHLYFYVHSVDHEILRGHASTKINILTLKMRPRHKRGVSNCTLGSAILLNPHRFDTAGGDRKNSVPEKIIIFKSNFAASWNETKQKY